jgi:histidinol-phosphatase (PHP family)
MPPPSDFHVHTQFSWDARAGDMEATCRRAVQVGLRAVAFTDHADFVEGVHDGIRPFDVRAYVAEIERCRAMFPRLRILSGVELGEPHRFATEAAAVLAGGELDRVLGSVHCLVWEGRIIDASELSRLHPSDAPAVFRSYLRELQGLADSSQAFDVLAHFDYPKRYWPHEQLPFREEDFEEEQRAVLRTLAARGSALEINTTRGADPVRGLCPGPTVLGWWVEEGGRALSFGSDAHDPARIALGFERAADLAEGAGFRANDDPTGFWLR